MLLVKVLELKYRVHGPGESDSNARFKGRVVDWGLVVEGTGIMIQGSELGGLGVEN